MLLTRSLQLTSYSSKHIISILSLNPQESPMRESTTPIIKITTQGTSRVMQEPSSKKAVLAKDRIRNPQVQRAGSLSKCLIPCPTPNPIQLKDSLGGGQGRSLSSAGLPPLLFWQP